MAVASFVDRDGVPRAPRNFGPPKRAAIRTWYQAATKQIPDAPKWEAHFENYCTVDEEAIVFTGLSWSLFISRARYLRD